MKKKRLHLKENLVRTMEIPQDLAYSEPVLILTGQRELSVENYKTIRKLCPDYIEIQTKNGFVEIHGKALRIPYYTEGELKVRGMIQQISMKR